MDEIITDKIIYDQPWRRHLPVIGATLVSSFVVDMKLFMSEGHSLHIQAATQEDESAVQSKEAQSNSLRLQPTRFGCSYRFNCYQWQKNKTIFDGFNDYGYDSFSFRCDVFDLNNIFTFANKRYASFV